MNLPRIYDDRSRIDTIHYIFNANNRNYLELELMRRSVSVLSAFSYSLSFLLYLPTSNSATTLKSGAKNNCATNSEKEAPRIPPVAAATSQVSPKRP